MAPLWDPKEADASVYNDVQNHSEGMISFTYHRPSNADLTALKNTQTYRGLIREQKKAPLDNTLDSVVDI